MRCSEILRMLRQDFPEERAMSWDNVGLLVGDSDWEVNKIFLAVDATTVAIEQAIASGADLIITHHPLIFSGEKKINDTDMCGRRIIRLIENKIGCYAMHTNFDIIGMADMAADMIELSEQEVLDKIYEENGIAQGIGRYGRLIEPMTLRECAALVRNRFQLEQVAVFGNLDRRVEWAAISTGSGEDYIDKAIELGLDVLITGDIKHHPGIDAVEQGLCVIDAGHYGLEHIFTKYMKRYLNEKCPQIAVVEQPLAFPFHMV